MTTASNKIKLDGLNWAVPSILPNTDPVSRLFKEKIPHFFSEWTPQPIQTAAFGCISFLSDEDWMAFVSELFGIASHICRLTSEQAGEIVPYLSVISAPVYLFHAIKESTVRFKLMITAIKTVRVFDALFWGARSMGAVGSALSDIIKPFVGGMALLGISQSSAVGFAFTHVIPFILMGLSIAGGGSEVWDLGKRILAWHKWKQIRAQQCHSLSELKGKLEYLMGPDLSLKASKKDLLNHKLDKTNFKRSHYATADDYDRVNELIADLLIFENKEAVDAAEAAIQPLIIPIEQLHECILSLGRKGDFFEQIDESLQLSDQLLRLSCDLPEQFSVSLEQLKAARDEIFKIKELLMREGERIIELFSSQLRLKLQLEFTNILSALSNFVSALLFMLAPQFESLGYTLSLTGSTLGLLTVILEKIMISRDSLAISCLAEFLKEQERRKKEKEQLENSATHHLEREAI